MRSTSVCTVVEKKKICCTNEVMFVDERAFHLDKSRLVKLPFLENSVRTPKSKEAKKGSQVALRRQPRNQATSGSSRASYFSYFCMYVRVHTSMHGTFAGFVFRITAPSASRPRETVPHQAPTCLSA